MIGFMLGDWLGLIIGTLFGITGIGVSIYLARRVEGFLQDMRRSQIDEKIAVTFRTASEVKTWEGQGIDVALSIRKVVADLKAVERVKKAMAADQHNELAEATKTLVNALKASKYDILARRIEDATKFLDVLTS